MDDGSPAYRLGIYKSHPGQLSLAIPPWIGVTSTGDGYGHRHAGKIGRNGEFYLPYYT